VLPATEVATGIEFDDGLINSGLIENVRIVPFNQSDDNHPPHPFNQG
jgi:hypothetical protein